MKFKVPFYKQTSDNTCTAASLLMVLAYFGKISKLDKNTEMKLYKNIRFPNRYNIAIAAQKYGLTPIIKTNVKDVELKKWLILNKTPAKEIERYDKAMRSGREIAKKLEIKEQLMKNVKISDIAEVLKHGGLALLNVNARLLDHEEVPHMVVVTGLNRQDVKLNDPLSEGQTIISKKLFNKAKNFYGNQTLIEIYNSNEIQSYKCSICGLHYRNKELASKCYAWCSRHNSCNLEVARQSIEASS